LNQHCASEARFTGIDGVERCNLDIAATNCNAGDHAFGSLCLPDSLVID
jgi:hypothetical protein